jgi:hypothetical protein
MAEFIKMLLLEYIKDHAFKNLYPWLNVKQPRVVGARVEMTSSSMFMVELDLAEGTVPKRFSIHVREIQ